MLMTSSSTQSIRDLRFRPGNWVRKHPGNELSGSGVGTKVSAVQFAADMKELRSVIGVLYDGASLKPLVVAPDGFFDYGWFKQFLTAAGPGGVDVITRHIYNLGPGQEASL
jgi:heparanase 1